MRLNHRFRASARLSGAVLLSACVLATGCAADGDISDNEEFVTACADGPTLRGIDVSYFQGSINWSQVANDGIDFAFIRVSDGTGFFDPRFQENWEGARANGIIRGVYQFFRPSQDPIAQADLLLDNIGTLADDDLPPVIDIEVTSGMSPAAIVERARIWIDRVEQATGKKPIIYTGKYFWQDEVGASDAFVDYPLWLPQYRTGCPDTPTPWTRWEFWQNSDRGQVAGIDGPVDTNFFNGDYEALLRLAGAEDGDTVAYQAMGVAWQRDADGTYAFTTEAPAEVIAVEYYVDGLPIGSARRDDSFDFADTYRFTLNQNERSLEVRGFDATGTQIARAVGLLDVTDSYGVFVRQVGEGIYEIGLERAPEGVAAIEVRVDDQYLLTDMVTSEARSTRNAVRSFFFTLGQRDFKITTFNADGSERGNLYRTFELR